MHERVRIRYAYNAIEGRTCSCFLPSADESRLVAASVPSRTRLAHDEPTKNSAFGETSSTGAQRQR
jgi:hypothetical protein